MKLVDMLILANTPRKKTPRTPKRSGNPSPSHVQANAAKHARTVAKYKAAMGSDEWVATKVLETRLGYYSSTVLPVLKRWETLGIVEHRPVNDGPYNRRKGWEWRFK